MTDDAKKALEIWNQAQTSEPKKAKVRFRLKGCKSCKPMIFRGQARIHKPSEN